MNFKNIELEVKSRIGILTISRPQALNALNAEVLSELKEFFIGLKSNTELLCLMLTGSGDKAFVAGADIKEMSAVDEKNAVVFAEKGQQAFQAIENCPIPVIAAVNGYALGGGFELAMACDFIIASDNAKFGLPEVSLGIIPCFGGTQRLSRYVGKAKAQLMISTGEIYSAQQVMDWGLVAEVVEAGLLKEKCLEIATSISKRSPYAVALAKRAVIDGYELSQAEGIKLEAELFGQAFSSDDKTEGVKAFLEKREAKFSGK